MKDKQLRSALQNAGLITVSCYGPSGVYNYTTTPQNIQFIDNRLRSLESKFTALTKHLGIKLVPDTTVPAHYEKV